MKHFNLYFALPLFFLLSKAYGAESPFKLEPNETLMHFFNVNNHKNILVSSKEIYLVSKNKHQAIGFPYKGFSDAFYSNDTLILLRQDTLFFLPKNSQFKKATRQIALKNLKSDLPVFNRIVVDASGIIWLSSMFSGVYSLDTRGNTILSRLTAPVINDLNVSKDSCLYVATNVGLYKYIPRLNNWIKYAEEALSGYEMPDNIIETILIDNKSNIWVLMPEHISFIAFGNNNEVHVPSFDYLGDKETRLLAINTFKMGYLLATTKGVLFLKNIHHDEHSGEVHATENQTALLLQDKDLKTPAVFKNEPVIFIGKNRKANYLFTSNGYWVTGE